MSLTFCIYALMALCNDLPRPVRCPPNTQIIAAQNQDPRPAGTRHNRAPAPQGASGPTVLLSCDAAKLTELV